MPESAVWAPATKTRAAVAAAVGPGATTTLTMGAINATNPIYESYMADYPVDQLTRESDGIFIMACR